MSGNNVFVKVILWFAVLGLVSGCDLSGAEKKASNQSKAIAIMTWNVQALFDGTEKGNEYAEYLEAAGWSREKYTGRLNAIAKALRDMERQPDIIALQELESADVLQDLARSLSAQRYNWTHFALVPGMSLGLGILSRFPLGETKAHSATINGNSAPRPMLEVRITPNGGTDLALFVCHWKSKLGGDDLTEATRRASARIIIRRIRELAESDPDLPVIIMGDLNENYDEFYRRGGSVLSALLPDDPHSAELSSMYGLDGDGPIAAASVIELQKDFLVLSTNKPPTARFFPNQVLSLYSPWTNEMRNGSYYYKKKWETIDHFLLSAGLFDGTGWEFEHCMVVADPPFTNSGGYPATYNPKTGLGLSDHLPLLLLLQFAR